MHLLVGCVSLFGLVAQLFWPELREAKRSTRRAGGADPDSFGSAVCSGFGAEMRAKPRALRSTWGLSVSALFHLASRNGLEDDVFFFFTTYIYILYYI